MKIDPKKIARMISEDPDESDYDGLEDDDKFVDKETCDACGLGIHMLFRCDGCRNAYFCSDCISNFNLKDPSGQLIVCHSCQQYFKDDLARIEQNHNG
jgi:hypothetical protein